MNMKFYIRCLGAAALLVLLTAVPAGATVIGGAAVGAAGAQFIKLRVPLGNPRGPANSVGENTFDLPNLYAFDEDQNIHLKADLATDVGRNPVPAGTTVASHYVFFDPGPAQHIFGTVDFDSRVLAIITSTGTLAASDYLAKTGVNYLNPGARGLEPGDYVTISGPKQIMFDTVASNPGDYVRVLTEFSPTAPRRITSNERRESNDSLLALAPFNELPSGIIRNDYFRWEISQRRRRVSASKSAKVSECAGEIVCCLSSSRTITRCLSSRSSDRIVS